ncbi:MAG: class I SAM-dependent methyltransferase, partial [Saprospiraceae bacterium]
MLTQEQIEEGMAYAEDNFQNEHAQHLHMDKRLIRRLFDLSGKKVLDFGCGMGGMSLWYAANWPCEVHAVDIDGHHIYIAQQLQAKYGLSNVRFEQRNILSDPLSGPYDFIFMNDVAEHIPLPVLTDILRQFKTLLAPGGKVFLTFPPWAGPFSSHLYHKIKIPWSQFLPESILLPMIERVNHPLVGEEESDLKSA